MVCLGNICRSPMAEGILKHHLAKNGLKAVVDSAGTSAWHHGEPPDTRATITCRKKGINISDQRSRPFIYEDFDRFDLIFAMDHENYNNIIRLTDRPEHRAKVHMIMNMVNPGANRAVPDPYYGGNDGFNKVFCMLEDGAKSIIKQYIKPPDNDN